jgi:hypothetical protein
MMNELKAFEQKTKPELTPEQKRALGEVWTDFAIDNEVVPENIEGMEAEELRNWLFETLMKDTERMVEEFGLKVDKKLVKEIKETDNIDEKSQLEMRFLEDICEKVGNIVNGFSKERSRRWVSWPKLIRETRDFNCVGATLIGINLLEKTGIKHLFGNPTGHVVNIVELSNSKRLYVDMLNGTDGIIELDAKEVSIEGIKTLKAKPNKSDYSLIPIYQKEICVGSVLGNLAGIAVEAEDATIPDDNLGKVNAVAFMNKYKDRVPDIDLSVVTDVLYPEKTRMRKSAEMKFEKRRVEVLWSVSESTHDYINSLSAQEKVQLKQNLKQNKSLIEQLILNNDKSVLVSFSSHLKEVMLIMVKQLEQVKQRHPEFYNEAVEMVSMKTK